MWYEPGEPRPYKPPAYALAHRFHEEDVTCGQQPWTLPGVLSLPKANGKVAGVVLVHGSGPNDRDGTIGACRPFRDLARGLASHDIAVLRYDNRAKVHAEKMTDSPETDTLEAKVIDDALAALTLLRNRSETDPRRIYLLGYGQGGMCGPDIARRDGKLAGLILLAAPARDLEDGLRDQFEHFARVSFTTIEQDPELKKDCERLDALIARTTKPDVVFLGAKARYWYHLMERDGQVVVEQAKKLDCPLLVLQGERDYQVTMKDYEIWRQALGDRPRVTCKLFGKLDHQFVPGVGPSTPGEAHRPGHVDEDVITTIAEWIRKTR
jgi:dienelactone hydrolase